MLRLPRFNYVAPESVEEACSFLKSYEGKIKLLAGGTDLVPSMKDRLFTPDYILDLKRVSGLNEIKGGLNGVVKIGALSTLTAIEESALLKEHFSALVEAAGLVGAPALRNMGTIGGNIALETRCLCFNQSHHWRKSIERCLKLGGEVCHIVQGSESCYACFVADTVPALIAFNARIAIDGSEGKRQCLLKEIYTQNGKTPNTLLPTDIITEIILPIPEVGSGSSYQKLMLREAIDFPLAGIAVHVTMDRDTCRDAKIVLGAVGPGPIEVPEAEEFLKGKAINEQLLHEVGEIAMSEAHPVANRGSTPGYRKRMVGVFTKRALREAVAGARKKEGK